jgi:hypothetical protein
VDAVRHHGRAYYACAAGEYNAGVAWLLPALRRELAAFLEAKPELCECRVPHPQAGQLPLLEQLLWELIVTLVLPCIKGGASGGVSFFWEGASSSQGLFLIGATPHLALVLPCIIRGFLPLPRIDPTQSWRRP